MICAGGGETDACDVEIYILFYQYKYLLHDFVFWTQRDQGGPLTCANKDDSPVVCGLVSFGLGACATPGFPGVYTEV